jgi:hypothetical protein
MQPAVKETLPIVLLPIALTAVLTALLSLPALGVRTLPGGDKRLATLEAGFTVTVPGDPALAYRLEAALGDWLQVPRPSSPAVATAEIKRPVPSVTRSKPVVLIDL